MDFDIGNEGAAGVIEGAAQGLGNAIKNMYTIQQSRRMMDMKQQELDNETDYKHAQIDYLEGRGQLAGAQADAYRHNIKTAEDKQQRAIDVGHDQIDTAHMQTQAQAGQYRNMLNQALQTPEGQEYAANRMSGATDTTGGNDGLDGQGPTVDQGQPSAQPQGQPKGGSGVVNNIMPGVGAQDQYNGEFVPTTTQGTMKALKGDTAAPKRNSSLQKALGQINAMHIDNREDAQYALDKYYGADWKDNPDAVNFLNTKFGGAGGAPGNITPGIPEGGQAAKGAQAVGSPSDLVPITGPDGTPYKIPRANLQKALQRGYRVRQ